MNTVTALKTVTKNVQKIVEGALAETGGLLRLAPCWVPRSFLQPGKRLKLHPDDLYAYRPEPRRHRRTLVCLHHARRQRQPHARRGPELRGRRQATLHPATSRRRVRRDAHRPVDLEEIQEVAGLFQVLRQHGADPASHAPVGDAGEARRAGGQAGVATTSRRSTTTSATTFPTPSWASSPAPRRRRSASASKIGTRATTASSISRKPIVSSPAPAG